MTNRLRNIAGTQSSACSSQSQHLQSSRYLGQKFKEDYRSFKSYTDFDLINQEVGESDYEPPSTGEDEENAALDDILHCATDFCEQFCLIFHEIAFQFHNF